jgi:hypothetical protein
MRTVRDNLSLSTQGRSRFALVQRGEGNPWAAYLARTWPNKGMQATAYSLRLAMLGSGFPPRLKRSDKRTARRARLGSAHPLIAGC